MLLLLLQLGTALDEVLGAIANASGATAESVGGSEARDVLVLQTLLLLQQLIVGAKRLPPWKPVSPALAAAETRQKAQQRPMDVSDLQVLYTAIAAAAAAAFITAAAASAAAHIAAAAGWSW